MLDQDLFDEANQSKEELFYEHEPLACDFETSTIKKHPNNALSLSLVIVDDQLPLNQRPYLNIVFLHKPEDTQDVALAMNAHLFVARAIFKANQPNVVDGLKKLIEPVTMQRALKVVDRYVPVADWDTAVHLIDNFLNLYYGENTPKLLGKNIASFDRGFFPPEINAYFQPEVIDVGDLWRNESDSKRNPNTAECCRRAGISDEVSHDAYEDNMTAMQLYELGLKRS